MSPRRRLVAALAVVLVVTSGVAATVLLVLNLSLLHQAARFERPIRTTTSDYDVRHLPRSAVTIRATFMVGTRRVTAKLSGGPHTTSDLTPTLHVVYDRAHPARAMLSEDFDRGRSTGVRTTVWVAGVVLFADVVAVVAAAVLGLRTLLHRSARSAAREPDRV